MHTTTPSQVGSGMERETGDGYLRRVAAFIRANDKGLAEAGYARRRRPQRRHSAGYLSLNPVGWFSGGGGGSPSPTRPVVFTVDTHHLFYILMRLEAIGLDVGSLDVTVDNPSKPMHYTHIDIRPASDKSDTLSLTSLRSTLTTVSGLSLGASWWTKAEPHTIDSELTYIYSSFTKLPALSIRAPGPKVIQEVADDPPCHNAVPLDVFKNLQTLECTDVDPRTLLGWDRLADGLCSLTIKRSGVEDVSDIFIGAVLDDQAHRDGTSKDDRRRQIPRRQRSFPSTPLPASVPEEGSPVTEYSLLPSPGSALNSYKWSLLRYLSLADNALTFLPTEPLPYLVSLTHLDLSSNLLVSVPHGLSVLHNLVSLNLADNMIDSVLGIYTKLGQVLHMNLSRNRLEVDLRFNQIDESAEIGRLATLPNIAEVWIEGNPLTEIEDNYRVACFNLFHTEGKTVGASLPLMIPLGGTSKDTTVPDALDVGSPSRTASSVPSGGGGRQRKRRAVKRVVDLDSQPLPNEARSATLPRIPSPLSHRPSLSDFELPDMMQDQIREGQVYRARIEALRSDMGEGWLKVFSQSHVSSPAAS
ncbi:hypothetical protein F5J12DRAFT_798867 [Pisolithus orientalis]|uniref:uncharacterized protein n=1 Tax=Pisolithus orientalis TaxID=936130 RepID=UPI0022242655|nr:uncharacterized protein F5J12DRAFT_798867 [Pisolithus orientalis]KAI6033126.1 hypothetical protein F5J12DRAFT_798867 [Pisolithus orientalis]